MEDLDCSYIGWVGNAIHAIEQSANRAPRTGGRTEPVVGKRADHRAASARSAAVVIPGKG